MISFSATLDPVNWTEILQGKNYLAFDVEAAQSVELYFTETAATPATSEVGITVESWPNSWDYEANGFDVELQRVWARGKTSIRGVRG